MGNPIRKGFILLFASLLLVMAGPAAAGQESKPAPEAKPAKPLSIYRLTFNVHEGEDGQRLNSRQYVMVMEENGDCAVRSSSRVPVELKPQEFQYMDVGLNLDCNIHERDGHVALEVTLEINNFATPAQEKESRPLVRNIRARLDTAVPLDKPTIVSQVDDAASRRRYELEVTVTKLK